MKTKIKRRFTGKLTGFITKEERNFSKKALKAYLAGKEHFRYKKELFKTPQIIN